MRPAARVQTSIEAVASVFQTPRPADAVLSAFFRARRFIGSKDRSAIAEEVYAVLRAHARVGWWTERIGLPQDARSQVLIWNMLDGVTYEQLHEICSGGKYAPAQLTPDEAKALRRIEGGTLDHPEMPSSVKYECPEWAEAGLRARFGADFYRELSAMLESAPLDLRVNVLKCDRATALKSLTEEGIRAKPTPYSPLGIRVEGRPPLGTSKSFKAGLVEIQDEGSQMVAGLVDAKAGEQVVDFCAGAGGKTLAIAAAMHNKGRVIACDVLDKRLKRAAERFRRAGLFNIETRPLTSERDPWVKRHKGMFDRVLVDAPCSGVGVWRRNPDSRWRVLGPGLSELVPLQYSILESASRLVKAGGRLVYATCSMLNEENAAQIEKFVQAHPEFSIVKCGLDGSDYLEMTPARHQTDGFFGAVLERSKAVAAEKAAEAEDAVELAE